MIFFLNSARSIQNSEFAKSTCGNSVYSLCILVQITPFQYCSVVLKLHMNHIFKFEGNTQKQKSCKFNNVFSPIIMDMVVRIINMY
jgi:hypothetical protein